VSAKKTELIQVVLGGLRGPITVNSVVYNMEMPAFDFLSDDQVADVVTYVRATFGNKEEEVTPGDVRRIRAALKSRFIDGNCTSTAGLGISPTACRARRIFISQ
jgi:hypothetical protein